MNKARRAFQGGLLALTLTGVFLLGTNAEAWCPFGGFEAIYTYYREGNLICSLGISNFYALGAVILAVLLLRRAFCGYMCPVGTISEWLGAASRRFGLRTFRVPAKLDRVLSLGKYVVLAAILAATWQLGELAFRGYCPAYALLSRHGADITLWAYVVAGATAAGSLLITMPFCRWLCPLAAVMNPLSRFGLGRIKRDAAACSSCGRCTASCPMAIPVDRLQQMTASRCLACMECVAACPGKESRTLSWGPPNWLGRAWPQAAVIAILLVCGGSAVAFAYFAPLPSFVRSRGVQPDHIASIELRIHGLTCRGRANFLVRFLERDDISQITGEELEGQGYYKLEAWPEPNGALVRIAFDPRMVDQDGIRRAITEPYYEKAANRWWISPFQIEGYSPRSLEWRPRKPVGDGGRSR